MPCSYPSRGETLRLAEDSHRWLAAVWRVLFSVYFQMFAWYSRCPGRHEGCSIKLQVVPGVLLFCFSLVCFPGLLIMVRSRSSSCLPGPDKTEVSVFFSQAACLSSSKTIVTWAMRSSISGTSPSVSRLHRCSTVLRRQCRPKFHRLHPLVSADSTAMLRAAEYLHRSVLFDQLYCFFFIDCKSYRA